MTDRKKTETDSPTALSVLQIEEVKKTVALIQTYYNEDCKKLVGGESDYFLSHADVPGGAVKLIGFYDNRLGFTATLALKIGTDILAIVTSVNEYGKEPEYILKEHFTLEQWQLAITKALSTLDSVCSPVDD